ncbi:MAG: TIR domain-containing protein [Pseudomonadales bacterium]|nr:TIR domain-containing protein [Pseudomonadales bacterium]
MSDIFVSYSREDRERVKPLVDALVSHGYDVWWDRELAPGDRFETVIDKEILRTKCVLVVWSRHSIDSTWVRNEALEGQDRDILVPVHLDQVRTAVAFRQTQGADLCQWPQHVDPEEFEGLLRSIAAKVGDAREPQSDFVLPRKRNWTPAIIVGLIVLALTGVWVTDINGRGNKLMDENGRISLAILPFASKGEGQGIANEIHRLLREVQAISVIHEVAVRDLPADTPLDEIVSKLSVQFLLKGEFIEDRQRQLLAVSLLDGKTLDSVWSEKYELVRDDYSRLRNQVAQDLIGALNIDLDIRSRRRLQRTTSGDSEAYRIYLRAQDFLRRADLDSLNQARDTFSQATELDRSFADAYSGLCRSYLGIYEELRDSFNFENAERACHRALTLDSENSNSYLALGMLYDVSGQYEKARIEYSKTLELDPANADALTGLGYVLSMLDQHGEAEKILQGAISIQRGYWKTYNSLGVYYFQQGSFQKAKENFFQVTYLAPSNVTAWANLGTARYFLGEYDQALTAWQRANELHSDPSSLSNLGSALFFLQRFSEAADMFRKAVELAPEDHRWSGNLGDALRFVVGAESEMTRAYETAIELANARLRINADDMFTTSRLAVYYAAIGDEQRAKSMIERAVAQSSADMNVLYSIAIAFSLMKQYAAAEEYIDKAITNGYLPVLVASDPLLASLQPLENLRKYYPDTNQ